MSETGHKVKAIAHGISSKSEGYVMNNILKDHSIRAREARERGSQPSGLELMMGIKSDRKSKN